MSARHNPAPATGQTYDVIILGAGLAGLSAALSLPAHWRVALLHKDDWQASASAYAQGGIAAALAPDDSPAAHLADTLTAGAGHCHAANAAAILTQAPAAIAWLQAAGVPWSRTAHGLHLTREGGHGCRRIVHAADHTGAAVMQTLWPLLLARPGVTRYSGWAALDLAVTGARGRRRCVGVRAVSLQSGRTQLLRARRVVLATGGSGQLYPRSSNPAAATGDGPAMAWRAGCQLRDLEFIQFHPTGLALPQRPADQRYPLISEALRGEGAWLCLPDGSRFMPAYDARAELAPRDIVARAIADIMRRHALPHVDLRVQHLPADFMATHFPAILASCRQHGIAPPQAPIPVAPLAHYACGGIRAHVNGRTDLPGLYAIGECAATGLHGANRLASNSLLECVVMGRAAAQDMAAMRHWPDRSRPPARTPPGRLSAWDDAQLLAAREQLQTCMWTHAGILRRPQSLAQGLAELSALRRAFLAAAPPQPPSAAWLSLRNLLDLACLTLHAAGRRQHSCGAHAWAPADP